MEKKIKQEEVDKERHLLKKANGLIQSITNVITPEKTLKKVATASVVNLDEKKVNEETEKAELQQNVTRAAVIPVNFSRARRGIALPLLRPR